MEKFIFLHQKNSDKRNFTLKITYNFLSCPFSESKSKGIIFWRGIFLFLPESACTKDGDREYFKTANKHKERTDVFGYRGEDGPRMGWAVVS